MIFRESLDSPTPLGIIFLNDQAPRIYAIALNSKAGFDRRDPVFTGR